MCVQSPGDLLKMQILMQQNIWDESTDAAILTSSRVKPMFLVLGP